jgi:uncharacterized membrane protein YfcA
MFLPVGIGGVLMYNSQGYVNWIDAVLIAVGIELGSAFSSKYALKLNAAVLKQLFGGALVLLGLYFILRQYILF